MSESDESPEPPAWNWRATHLWDVAAFRDVVWFAFGVCVLLIAFWMRDVLTPFLVAFALAYVVKPAVDLAEERWSVPRAATATGVVLLGLGVLIGLVAWFAPLVVEQLLEVATRVPTAVTSGLKRLGFGSVEVEEQAREWVERVEKDPSSVLGTMASSAASALGYLGRFVNALTYLATAAVIVPLYTVYFAWRYDAFLGHVKALVPAGPRERVLELFGKFDDTFGRFVRGRIAIGLIQVVLFSVGFWAIDLPFWLLIGVLTGLMSIVPIVGFVGWPLAILAQALEGGDWNTIVVWPSIVYAVVQVIETWVLTPVVQGRSLNISPFMVLFAIIVGGSVGGFFGVLLAVPLVNCIAIVYTEEIQPRLDEWSRSAARAGAEPDDEDGD